MGADAALVEGAYRAAAPVSGVNMSDAWVEFAKGVAATTQQTIEALEKKREAKKLKTDTFYANSINRNANAVMGVMQSTYDTVVSDMEFQADIYGSVVNDNAAAAALQIQNAQVSADSSSISETLKLHDRILNDSTYEGAGLSESVTNDALMSQWVNPNLSMKYTFVDDAGNEQVVIGGTVEGDTWLENNKRDILRGKWKQKEIRYGMLKDVKVIESQEVMATEMVNNPAWDQWNSLSERRKNKTPEPPRTIPMDVGTNEFTDVEVDAKEWVSADDIKRHLEESMVDVETQGAITDLGLKYRDKGVAWLAANPGREAGMIKNTAYAAIRDQRQDLNVGILKQDVQAALRNLRPHQTRSVINDPPQSGNSLIDNLRKALMSDIVMEDVDGVMKQTGSTNNVTIDDAFAGLTVDGKPLDADNSGAIDTVAEIENMIDVISSYDPETMGTEVRTAVDQLVENYYTQWTIGQFLLGSNGEYEEGLAPGATTGGTPLDNTLGDILDWN